MTHLIGGTLFLDEKPVFMKKILLFEDKKYSGKKFLHLSMTSDLGLIRDCSNTECNLH